MDDRDTGLRNATAIWPPDNADSNVRPLSPRFAGIVPHAGWDGLSLTGLEGGSDAIARVRELLRKVAVTGAGVLILGESGTGKEVAARQIHRLSQRRDGPFIPVNCGAIPADLLESELFGHERGAFTGALATRPGRFELAEGGTLFLDEIGDMSLDMQIKLLRIIQERTYERVGGNLTRTADVRIVAATHRDLEVRMTQERFREDLYYRLNVFPVEIPPLRRRVQDIPVLLQSMLARLAFERETARFSDGAVELLQSYDWPGNVRELSNIVERLCILFPGERIDAGKLIGCLHSVLPRLHAARDTEQAAVLSPVGRSPPPAPDLIDQLDISPDGVDLKEMMNRIELHFIRLALERADGVVSRAAKLLHMGRTTLVEKLRKHEVDRASLQ